MMKFKIEKTIALVQEWLEVCNYQVYSLVNGGKDSLVSSHLIRQIYPDCPMVWVNQGPLFHHSDCIELLGNLKAQGWNIVELCPPQSFVSLCQYYGLPLERRTTLDLIDLQMEQILIEKPLKEYEEIHQMQGFSWGIRTEESKGRADYLRSKGLLFQEKSGKWVCSPVGDWEIEEVWQYIDDYGLSYPALDIVWRGGEKRRSAYN